MSTKIDEYLRSRWATRMASALELVASVGVLVPPQGDGWSACFEGLRRLFAVDVKLAAKALGALRDGSRSAAADRMLARFSRRLNNHPTAWRRAWCA